ncbi:MAG: hypothetical protein ACOC1I_05040 [Spirochaetota bacterium]
MKTETKNELKERLERRGLEFRRTDAWEQIQSHVGTHKYLLDLRSDEHVDWADAEDSWERTVMSPLLEALERQQAGVAFPGRTNGDLFIEVSDHWYYLKEQKDVVSPDEAVASFTRRFGQRVARWLSLTFVRTVAARIRADWTRSGRIADAVRDVRERTADTAFYG